MQLKSPAENPIVKDLYQEHLCEPGSERAHEMLHTTYINRKRIDEEIHFSQEQLKNTKKIAVKVCVGTCCYLSGSYDLFSALKDKLNDERFKNIELSATFCFENCAQSPCVMVDDELIAKATVEKVIDKITKKATATQ